MHARCTALDCEYSTHLRQNASLRKAISIFCTAETDCIIDVHQLYSYTCFMCILFKSMARVQLIIPNADRSRYLHQAAEGLSLSAWLRAADERLNANSQIKPFKSAADIEAFFHSCHDNRFDVREPDWKTHLAGMNESRAKGMTST